MMRNILSAGFLAGIPLTLATASCTSHKIPVTIKDVPNFPIYAPNLNLSTVAGVTSFLSSSLGLLGQLADFIPVSGTYQIAARYCTPVPNAQAPASRANEVQLLLHGVPYNSSYWFGLPGNPDGSEKYNWVDYATSQGYPVLAIDNLGAGNSDKPDPILVVQQPAQTEIVHQIVQLLRAGKLPFAPKRVEKVIFVGHSLASVIGNGIATHYPTDFDALVLTGYSYTLAQAVLGILLTFLVPAQIQNPKFAHLLPGYLAFGSAAGKREAYYYDDDSFSSDLAAYDFAHEDTITIGQIYSAFSGLQKASSFTGDVLALTGDHDALFCSTGSRYLGPQNCGSGDASIPAQSKVFWPKANFGYYLAANASHATTLHYSAPESIAYAHEFLSKAGY